MFPNQFHIKEKAISQAVRIALSLPGKWG